MPFQITESESIAPGTYRASLEKVELSRTEKYGGSDFRKWHFLVDVDGKLVPISATTSVNTSTRTTSFKWLQAILGREIKAGETIDDPVGSQCLVVIVTKDNGFSKITDVLPLQGVQEVVPGLPR
jgi:hypothetical protein